MPAARRRGPGHQILICPASGPEEISVIRAADAPAQVFYRQIALHRTISGGIEFPLRLKK